MVENVSQSGPQGLLRKELLYLQANVSGSGDFSSFFFGLLFIVSYSQPSFTILIMSIHSSHSPFSSPDLLALMYFGQEAR